MKQMFADFVKWIRCASCIRATITGLKGLLIAVGPSAIAIAPMLGYPVTDVERGIATATTVLGLVLTIMEQMPSALVKSTKGIEGVQVHVDTSVDPETGALRAPESVVNLANSPTPDVFPMIGGPRVPSEHDDAPDAATVSHTNKET